MRLRALRKLEEIEIRTEDKDLRASGRAACEALIALRGEAVEEGRRRDQGGARDASDRRRALGKRRTELRASARARRGGDRGGDGRCASRSPSWCRTRAGSARCKGTVTDLSGVVFKADDRLKFAVLRRDHLEDPGVRHQWPLLHARGRQSCRAGAATASRSACSSTSSRTPTSSPCSRYAGGRKFLVASRAGRGFVVPEDECLANTRKGKQVAQRQPRRTRRAR